MSFDASQFGKMFAQAMLPGNEFVQNIAVRKMADLLQSNGIHPTEIQFVLNQNGDDDDLIIRMRRVMTQYEEQIEILKREVAFFRRTASAEDLKAAAKVKTIVDHWERFLEVVERKFAQKDGTLPRNWRRHVAGLLHVTPRVIKAWEDRRVTIPQDAFEKMTLLDDAQWANEAVKRREARSTPAPEPVVAETQSGEPIVKAARAKARAPFIWADYPEIHREVVGYFLAGDAGKSEIARAVGWKKGEDQVGVPSPEQIQSITLNGPPPEFLNASIRLSGPMDWPEAWKIAATIFRPKFKSWLFPLNEHFRHYGTESAGIGFDIGKADQALVDAFRAQYRQHFTDQDNLRLERLKRPARQTRESKAEAKIERMFERAGPDGIAFRDLPEVKNLPKEKDGHQRMKTLERTMKIFATGMQTDDGRPKFVHHSFRDRWPDEWRIATDNFRPDGLVPEPVKAKDTPPINIADLNPLQRSHFRTWIKDGRTAKSMRRQFEKMYRVSLDPSDLNTLITEIKFESLEKRQTASA